MVPLEKGDDRKPSIPLLPKPRPGGVTPRILAGEGLGEVACSSHSLLGKQRMLAPFHESTDKSSADGR